MVKKLLLAGALCGATACVQTEEPARTSMANRASLAERGATPERTAMAIKAAAMPVPPQQSAPWPHENDAFSVIVATLFDQGLADPRGLEYREIEIPIGNPWDGGGAPVKTHGWILPSENGKKERFAIAWNGLIYPLVKVGAPADVRKDWAPDAPRPRDDFSDFHQTSEGDSVNYSVASELKMAMLLHLGETATVKRLRAKSSHAAANAKDDLYAKMATNWAWFAFERAVCAHERGDDKLALRSAQLLTHIQPLIEAEAKRREVKSERAVSNANFPDRPNLYLPFLVQLPALLRDSQRRVENAKAAAPGAKASVAQLIEDLQNVDARQWGQPGGVSLASDKRVQALVKRGGVAVEPLLDSLEHDDRLTRSVSFGRDFFRDRHLISVAEAANAALTDLLRVNFKTYDEKGQPLSRAQMAQQIRVYWQKMGDLSPAERFYATLKDDKAGKDAWMQAAANIVQPGDVEIHGSWMTIPNRKPGQKIKLRGEVLRDGRAPSVAQLLARRSDDIAAIRTGTSDEMFLFKDAAQMALYLANWDKKAAIPILKKRLARAYSIGAKPHDVLKYDNPAKIYGDVIVRMTLARARAGDVAAYDEYAKWITKADLKFSSGAEKLQKPLIQGATRPSIGRAVDVLFNDPKSPWSNVFARKNGFWLPHFWQTPLAMTHGFRKQAMRGLADKSAVGTITFNPRKDWLAHGKAKIKISGFTMSSKSSDGDPATPPPGQKRAFRVCDAWAYFYAKFQGGPNIQLFWPQPKRDVAVAACRNWLKNK